jgi:predicted N-formylglutamate amidohydrolase
LFLLLGDHAGNLVPERLGALGLPPEELRRHIALDIGIADLGRSLAEKLDAAFVEQRYSRLVVDCNRSPDLADSIAEHVDGTAIPGNADLNPNSRRQRYAEIFAAYHGEIEQIIEERASQGRGTILVSLHSFTPLLGPQKRPWDIGVLYDGGETRFARSILGDLERSGGWCIGDNQPYRMDGTDFTVPRHAYARKLPYIELEMRQDLLGNADCIDRVSDHLASVLVRNA